MYRITLGSHAGIVVQAKDDARRDSFSGDEIADLISCLLDRKERNNGVGRYLMRCLRTIGSVQYEYAARHMFAQHGFMCVRAGTQDRYSIRLFGDFPQDLLGRLNRTDSLAQAITITRRARERRRLLQLTGPLHFRGVPLPRSLAGASGALKWHFRNSRITWNIATRSIAKAIKRGYLKTHDTLRTALNETGIAALRLTGGFVFRVDLLTFYQGMFDLEGLVKLSSTNDNSHAAYRRLRKALRTFLRCEQKQDLREEKLFRAEQRRKDREHRLCAA